MSEQNLNSPVPGKDETDLGNKSKLVNDKLSIINILEQPIEE